MSTVSPEVLAFSIQERAALAMQEASKKAVEGPVREGLPMYVWRVEKYWPYLPKNSSRSPKTNSTCWELRYFGWRRSARHRFA